MSAIEARKFWRLNWVALRLGANQQKALKFHRIVFAMGGSHHIAAKSAIFVGMNFLASKTERFLGSRLELTEGHWIFMLTPKLGI